MNREIETKWELLQDKVRNLHGDCIDCLVDDDSYRGYNEADEAHKAAVKELEEFEKEHFERCGVCGDRHPAPECSDYSNYYDY